MKNFFIHTTKRGFIQIPILIAIFIGLIVVGGGTYEGIKIHKQNQETKEKESAQEKIAQTTIATQVISEEVATSTKKETGASTGTMSMLSHEDATAPKNVTPVDKPAVVAPTKSANVTPKPVVEPKVVVSNPASAPNTTPNPVVPSTQSVQPAPAPVSTVLPPTPTPTPESTPELALTIADVDISPGESTTNFSWSTNVPAVGKIIYSELGGSNVVIWSPTSLSNHHYANITKLIPGTTYNYTIEVVQASSGKSASKTGTFTTTGSLIQSIKPSVSPYDISIDWTTPVQAICSIAYFNGETPVAAGYQKDQTGTQHHAFSHDTLIPNTTYGYTITAMPISGGASQTYSGTVKTNPPLEVTVTPPAGDATSVIHNSIFDSYGNYKYSEGTSPSLLSFVVNAKYDVANIVGYTMDLQGSENVSGVGENAIGGGIISSTITRSGLSFVVQKNNSLEMKIFLTLKGIPTGEKIILPMLTSITVRDSNGVQTNIPVNIPGTTLYY